MHLCKSLAIFAAIMLHVSPTTIQVNVGQHGLLYMPKNINASAGDQIQFNFYNNHTVVQSTFSTPCEPLENGFYSGLIPSSQFGQSAPAKFIITINNSQPIYFYCLLYQHCQEGMVGGINVPASDLVSYFTNALLPSNATNRPPPRAQGGIISTITGTEVSSVISLPLSTNTAAPSLKFVTTFAATAAKSISNSSGTTPLTVNTGTTTTAATYVTVMTTSATTTSSTSATATAKSTNAAFGLNPGKGWKIAFGVPLSLMLVAM